VTLPAPSISAFKALLTLVGVNEQLAKNDMIKEILVALDTLSYENQT
jgi:hypothetical protein